MAVFVERASLSRAATAAECDYLLAIVRAGIHDRVGYRSNHRCQVNICINYWSFVTSSETQQFL